MSQTVEVLYFTKAIYRVRISKFTGTQVEEMQTMLGGYYESVQLLLPNLHCMFHEFPQGQNYNLRLLDTFGYVPLVCGPAVVVAVDSATGDLYNYPDPAVEAPVWTVSIKEKLLRCKGYDPVKLPEMPKARSEEG